MSGLRYELLKVKVSNAVMHKKTNAAEQHLLRLEQVLFGFG